MGTELTRRGVDLPAPGWSARALDVAPELVADIHRDYVAAGATVHTANTFRTKRRSVGARWEELARRAVAIARANVGRAARRRAASARSKTATGPTSARASASRDEHRELARVAGRRRRRPSPVRDDPRRDRGRGGGRGGCADGRRDVGGAPSDARPGRSRDAARACVDAGASAVLVNCVAARDTLPLVEQLAGLGVPFGAYANAGDAHDGLGWDADAEARRADRTRRLARSLGRGGRDDRRRLLRNRARARRSA